MSYHFSLFGSHSLSDSLMRLLALICLTLLVESQHRHAAHGKKLPVKIKLKENWELLDRSLCTRVQQQYNYA